MLLKKMSSLLCVVLLMQSCSRDKQDFLSIANARVIAPAFQLLALQTTNLTQSTADACNDGMITPRELKQLRHGWLVSMSAWQQAQVFRLGALGMSGTLRQQYQYWPDIGNKVEATVRELMGREHALSAVDIDNAGIYAQGFPAIEYVLFDRYNTPDMFHEKGTPSLQRCIFLQHATQKLSTNSVMLDRDWVGNESEPSEERSGLTIDALLVSVISQLEMIKHDKLEKPLGLYSNDQRPDVYRSEAWRSRESLALIRSNVFILGKILDAPQAGLLELIDLDVEGERLIEKIRKQLLDINHALLRINISYNESLKSENGIAALHELLRAIDTLLMTCKNELPDALGVKMP